MTGVRPCGVQLSGVGPARWVSPSRSVTASSDRLSTLEGASVIVDGLGVWRSVPGSASPAESARVFSGALAGYGLGAGSRLAVCAGDALPTPGAPTKLPPVAQELAEAYGVPWLLVDGVGSGEAIATLITLFRGLESGPIIVVSPRTLFAQFLNEHVRVYDPQFRMLADEDVVRERFGVGPSGVPDYLALTGQPWFGLDGVAGVGHYTARALLSRCGSLEGVKESVEDLPSRLRDALVPCWDQLFADRESLTFRPNDALMSDFAGKVAPPSPDLPALRRLHLRLGIPEIVDAIPVTPIRVRSEFSFATCRDDVLRILDAGEGAVTVAGVDSASDLTGFALGRTDRVVFVEGPRDEPHVVDSSELWTAVKEILEDPAIPKIGHDVKTDIVRLADIGIRVRGVLGDTAVAAHLHDPDDKDPSIEFVLEKYTGHTFPDGPGCPESESGWVDCAEAVRAMNRAAVIPDLHGRLVNELRREGLLDPYMHTELLLIEVVAEVEKNGLLFDLGVLRGISESAGYQANQIEAQLRHATGRTVNLNSPMDVLAAFFDDWTARAVFEELGGASTDGDTLRYLAQSDHPFAGLVLRYRSACEAKEVCDRLLRLSLSAGPRLRTHFSQTRTRTGRLTSDNPGFQNLPSRGQPEHNVGCAVVAEEGHVIVAADYDQIELRVLAHASDEPVMIQAFHERRDFHAETAKKLLGRTDTTVSENDRRIAKMVNFGIIYGLTAHGLKKRLGPIDGANAAEFRKKFFDVFPAIRRWRQRAIASARDAGYVRTPFGWKRNLPEINSRSRKARGRAERAAINTPIQGGAAHIIKTAMIRIHRRIENEHLPYRLVLQVHDELVFEVPEGRTTEAIQVIREEMERAADLAVPLTVSIGAGRSWSDAKERK